MSARSILAASLIVCTSLVNFAAATVHLWHIDELYSDANIPLEFIELSTSFDSQHLFKTGGNNSRLISRETGGATHDTFVFPSDLETATTANRSVLLGTANLAIIASVTPDFILPAGFLLPGGGQLDFVSDLFGTFTTVTYPALPTNQQSYYSQAIVVGQSTPTNFAGVEGVIPLTNVWHNTAAPLDINADSLTNALDVLLIVNELNAHGTRELELPAINTMPPPFYDANDDRLISPLDVLRVVNFLNAQSLQAAAGIITLPVIVSSSAVAAPEPETWTLATIAASLIGLASWRRFDQNHSK
jgi:hypothetical protein